MVMKPGLRKLVFIIHLTVSVGWVGAVIAYLALDVSVARGADEATLRGAYIAMDVVATGALVPLAISSLVSGLVLSLGTKWGLFRHYWTLITLILTVLAVGVLLVETRTIGQYAAVAADPTTTVEELRMLGNTLVHSGGGLLVLLVIMWLNVYKPRGLTPYGWRKQQESLATTRA